VLLDVIISIRKRKNKRHVIKKVCGGAYPGQNAFPIRLGYVLSTSKYFVEMPVSGYRSDFALSPNFKRLPEARNIICPSPLP